jgi:hypothetical protein
MICRVVYILIICHLSELGDAVKFLFVKKKKEKKKNSYCTSLFIDVTKGLLHLQIHKVEYDEHIPIYCDNTSAISISKKTR